MLDLSLKRALRQESTRSPVADHRRSTLKRQQNYTHSDMFPERRGHKRRGLVRQKQCCLCCRTHLFPSCQRVPATTRHAKEIKRYLCNLNYDEIPFDTRMKEANGAMKITKSSRENQPTGYARLTGRSPKIDAHTAKARFAESCTPQPQQKPASPCLLLYPKQSCRPRLSASPKKR